MKIVVIGGTGLIGSKVVATLKQKGHEVLAAAPNTGINRPGWLLAWSHASQIRVHLRDRA